MKWLKKSFASVGTVLLLILLLPLLLLGLVLYVLFSPIKRIGYYCSPYYKDTKRKFRLFQTEGWSVKIFNHLSRKGIPFTYHYWDDRDYFVLDRQILFPGWSGNAVKEEGGIWMIQEDTSEDTENWTPLDDLMAQEVTAIQDEHRLLPARLLVFLDDYYDCDLAVVRACPYLHCYQTLEDM